MNRRRGVFDNDLFESTAGLTERVKNIINIGDEGRPAFLDDFVATG